VTSASTLAPNNLTLAQVRGIYNCTFTNWNQVGGASGPIQRYWPQPGSGTQQFALSDITGFDPMTISTASCPTPIVTQENTGSLINTNGDQQEALVPYSIANWSAMSQGTITDERFGQEYFALDDTSDPTYGFELPVRSIGGGQFEARTPTAGDPNGPIAEANVRLVWNVIDNTTGANSYTAAKRFVGFDNVASPSITSPLCNGDKASTLIDYGFGPLTKTADPTHNIPGTACRLY
jgi:hypothetical protein